MDFSAFMQMLKHYKREGDDGKDPGVAEFIRIITDALIPDDVIESGAAKRNPMYGYSDRMLEYIFKGEERGSASKAAAISRVMDIELFQEYFDDLGFDAQDNISGELSEFGFYVAPVDVGRACGSIMAQLMEHISKGLPEAVAKLDYKARASGQMVKDVPPATIELRDNQLHINGESITVDMSGFSEQEADGAMRYVQALYEAYESKLKRKIGADDIDSLPERLRENYIEQNRAFYYADAVQHNVRELFDDGEEEFSKLKEDELSYIRNTYWRPHDDGFERLVAVLDRAMEADLSSSSLANIRNLINNLAKMGICHILVNEGEIKSWVIEDD